MHVSGKYNLANIGNVTGKGSINQHKIQKHCMNLSNQIRSMANAPEQDQLKALGELSSFVGMISEGNNLEEFKIGNDTFTINKSELESKSSENHVKITNIQQKIEKTQKEIHGYLNKDNLTSDEKANLKKLWQENETLLAACDKLKEVDNDNVASAIDDAQYWQYDGFQKGEVKYSSAGAITWH